MDRKKKLALMAAGLAGTAFATTGRAATKANNTTALNAGGSWVGGVAPGSGDIAVWDSTVTGANSSALGGSVSWDGIQITNPGGAVAIATTSNAVLTLGASGIDMSTATQNLSINNAIVAGADQNWAINGGRTLNLFTVNANPGQGLSGSGNITLSRSGSGTAMIAMQAGKNGSIGFTDSNANGGFSGDWTVGSGVFIETIRNGQAAWGTGTIHLNGGTIAQWQGNWTWTNNIDAQADSTIANNSSGQHGRYLKLQSQLSGAGGLTFTDLTGAMDSTNGGFVLVNDNSAYSGTMTIASNAKVRVGGVIGTGPETGTPAAGTTGTLGSGNVVNNGVLTFTRTNALTVANNISGSGSVNLGSSGISGTGTQIVTYTGNATYTGVTNINSGTLLVNGSSTGGNTYTVASGATLGGTGSIGSTITVNSGATLTGGTASGIGTLGLGSGVTLAGTYLADLNGATSDLLNVTGLLDISDGTLNLNALATPGASVYVLASYGSLGGSQFASVLNLPTGYGLDYTYNGNHIALVSTAIPTPAALPAGLAMLGLLAVRRRRDARPQ